MLGQSWIEQPGVLKLDQNERSETPPAWAQKALAEMTPFVLNRYPQRGRLERKLAEFHGVLPQQVLVTNGSDESIQYLFQSLPAAHPVVLPLPTFGIYQDQIRRYPVKAHVIPPLDGLRLDMQGTIQAVTALKGALVILVRPNNPTGEMVAAQELSRLMDACVATDSVLLLDEAYADFCEADLAIQIDEQQANKIILRTFSKAYGLAGLRVGYAVGASQLIQPMRQRAMPYNVSTPALLIAEQGLSKEAQLDVASYCRQVRLNTQRLMDWLSLHSLCFVTSAANFVMVKLNPLRAKFVSQAMAHQGIKVRMFDRPELIGWVRISVPLDDQRLFACLEQVISPDLICLDVDGCLVDVKDSFEATVIEAVLRATKQTITRQTIVQTRARGGFNDDWVLTHELISKLGVSMTLTDVRSLCESIYWGTTDETGLHQLEFAILSPATRDQLQNKAQLAMVTGRSTTELEPVFDLLGLKNDMLASTIDQVEKGKPDPEGIWRVKSLSGASRLWMVGDNVDDIHAAHAAGAVAIGVGEDLRHELEAAGAAIVLSSINEIGSLL